VTQREGELMTYTAEERHYYGLDEHKDEDSVSKDITETQVSAIRAAWAQGLSGGVPPERGVHVRDS